MPGAWSMIDGGYKILVITNYCQSLSAGKL